MVKPRRLRIGSIALVVLALVAGHSETLLAQQTPPFKGDPAKIPKFRIMMEAIDQRARELGLIDVVDDPAQAEFVRRRRRAWLSEDFEKLYSINVEKIASQLSASTVDHRALSDATADLKKRASRIKDLVPLLQVADRGEKVRYDENSVHLATMLPELNRLIISFLESPVFRLNSPNDFEVRLKAGRDLESIIRLSDAINRISRRSLKLTARN